MTPQGTPLLGYPGSMVVGGPHHSHIPEGLWWASYRVLSEGRIWVGSVQILQECFCLACSGSFVLSGGLPDDHGVPRLHVPHSSSISVPWPSSFLGGAWLQLLPMIQGREVISVSGQGLPFPHHNPSSDGMISQSGCLAL